MNKEKWDKLIADARNDPVFQAENTLQYITECFACKMQEDGVDYAELARRCGVKERKIKSVMAGHGDPEIQILTKMAAALGLRLSFTLTD